MTFLVGSIGPDCGISSDEGRSFDPPYEITYWLRGIAKKTCDHEVFFKSNWRGKSGMIFVRDATHSF